VPATTRGHNEKNAKKVTCFFFFITISSHMGGPELTTMIGCEAGIGCGFAAPTAGGSPRQQRSSALGHENEGKERTVF